MTSENDQDHGTIYMPCVPLGPITVTCCDTTQHGTIASVDLGGGVGVHIHTAEAARELLGAALEALRILDPDIRDLLAEGGTCHDGAEHPCGPDCEDEPDRVMYGGVPLDVAQPEDIPVPECSRCGITDPIRVSEAGKCWNSTRCAERQAEKASAL